MELPAVVEQTVSASVDRAGIINAMRTNLDAFASVVMPEDFKFAYPPYYHALFDELVKTQSIPRNFAKYALGFPRGFAKTTWIKLFVVYLIIFSQKRFILITLATDRMAENFLSDVADMLTGDNVVSLFGDWRQNCGKNTLTDKEFSFAGRKLKLAAMGAGSSLRGIVRNNKRPDIQLMDDIQTREDADSDLSSEKLFNWMLGTLLMTRSPFGCQHIFVGNMYPTENCILKKLRDSKDWTSFITGAILANGESLWPELHPVTDLYDELEGLMRLGKDAIFMSEKMNDPTPQLKASFDQSKVAVLDFADEVHQGNFVIIDPSGRKKTSDNTVIGYFEIYDNKPHLVSLLNEVFTPKQTISAALGLCSKHRCVTIVSESVAYQETLLFWFEEALRALKVTHITLIPITPKGVSKNSRILTMLKQLQSKEVSLHPRVLSEVINQIYKFNPKKTDNVDDVLDIVAYAPRVVNEYGLMIAIPDVDSEEYLEIGVAPEHETSAI
jgi:hypothetical protein